VSSLASFNCMEKQPIHGSATLFDFGTADATAKYD
jgi:hypothetical protein